MGMPAMIIPGTGFASSQAYVLVLGYEFGQYATYDNDTGKFQTANPNDILLPTTLTQPQHDYTGNALSDDTTKFCLTKTTNNFFQYGTTNATWPSSGSQIVPTGFQPYQRGQSVMLACALPIYTEIGNVADKDKAKYANASVSVTIRRATTEWAGVDKSTVIYDSGRCANPAWSDGYTIPASAVKTLVDPSVEVGQTYYYQYHWTANPAYGTGDRVISAHSEFKVVIKATTSLQDCISLCDSTNVANPLKIKFNEKLGSVKYNYADTITATLGGEYPIVRRNGKQKYRTFTIEGLISQEANEGFATLNSAAYAGLDSYGEWTIKELMYRNAVIDFLHNGAIKLYSSTQEGNMLIRLTNVSLTPNDVLGRNIWTFSATATEIAAATPENLQRFGFAGG